jgi:hypothetical protein
MCALPLPRVSQEKREREREARREAAVASGKVAVPRPAVPVDAEAAAARKAKAQAKAQAKRDAAALAAMSPEERARAVKKAALVEKRRLQRAGSTGGADVGEAAPAPAPAAAAPKRVKEASRGAPAAAVAVAPLPASGKAAKPSLLEKAQAQLSGACLCCAVCAARRERVQSRVRTPCHSAHMRPRVACPPARRPLPLAERGAVHARRRGRGCAHVGRAGAVWRVP